MAVGNEILPNAYIDNIELFDNKINFSVFVMDTIGLTWSDNEKYSDLMEIKIFVCKDATINSEVSSGVSKYSKFDDGVESFLLSKLKSSESIGQIEGMNNLIAFVKEMSVPISMNLDHLSIFANVCIPSLGVEGPIASEKVLENKKILTTTNVLYKGGTQYYGPAHIHQGVYMEGMTHTNRPHSALTLKSVPNLKLKDFRTQKLMFKKNKTKKPTPAFSDLYDSFDKNTDHNYMFFVNKKEIILTQTKYGKYFRDSGKSTIKDLLYDFSIRSLSIKRNKVKKYFRDIPGSLRDQSAAAILETDLVSIARQQQTEMKLLHGKEISFLSHNFGESVLGFHFKDDLNDRSYGDYQYTVELMFRDPTINYVKFMIRSIESVLVDLKRYANSLNIKINYDNFLKRPTPTFFSNSSDLHITAPQRIVKYKELLYDMSEEQKKQDLYRLYNLVNPKTCTQDSVQIFILEVGALLQTMKTIFDINDGNIKSNYDNPSNPKGDYKTHNFTLTYSFKNIITPSDSKLHLVYNQEKITVENIEESVKPTPQYASMRNNKINFGKDSNKIGSVLNNNLKSNSPQASFTVRNTASPTEVEKFVNSSDFLGNESKFQSFDTKEKCELKDTTSHTKVENAILTGTDNAEEVAIAEQLNKIEILTGFEMENGSFNLKKPMWQNYIGQRGGYALIIKQSPLKNDEKSLMLPFTDKYIVLNNTGKFDIPRDLNTETTILQEDFYQYLNYNFVYTTNTIVENNTNTTVSTATQAAPQTAQPPTQAAPQVPMIQTTPTTGGGY